MCCAPRPARKVQGFLTGRPQPIDAFKAYLASDGDNVRAFASAG